MRMLGAKEVRRLPVVDMRGKLLFGREMSPVASALSRELGRRKLSAAS